MTATHLNNDNNVRRQSSTELDQSMSLQRQVIKHKDSIGAYDGEFGQWQRQQDSGKLRDLDDKKRIEIGWD